MKNNQTTKENFDFALENHKKNNLEIAEKLYKKILYNSISFIKQSNIIYGK